MQTKRPREKEGYRLVKSGKYKPFSTWVEEQTLATFKELCESGGLQINHAVTEALDAWCSNERARRREEEAPSKKKK